MNVDPASTSTVKSSMARKVNDVLMRERWTLMKLRVKIQKPQSATWITDEQFSKNEIVSANNVCFKQ